MGRGLERQGRAADRCRDRRVDERPAARELSWETEAKLTWNLVGLKATYDDLADARERLGYSAPPRWATIRAWVPYPEKDEIPWEEKLLSDPEPVRLVEVAIEIAETQVSVKVNGGNEYAVNRAFRLAREVIESKAVTKVPYHMRGEQLAVESSSWTKAVGWVEKHPGLTALIAAVVGLIGAVLGAVL